MNTENLKLREEWGTALAVGHTHLLECRKLGHAYSGENREIVAYIGMHMPCRKNPDELFTLFSSHMDDIGQRLVRVYDLKDPHPFNLV